MSDLMSEEEFQGFLDSIPPVEEFDKELEQIDESQLIEGIHYHWVTIEGKRARAFNPFVDLPKKDPPD